MSNPADTLKLISDPTRLRLLALLRQDELSVAEIQDILEMGQSRISSHLALLRQGNVVIDRKEGKKSFYSFHPQTDEDSKRIIDVACDYAIAPEEKQRDQQNRQRILQARQEKSARYFNSIAGKLGKNYCPGRSWQAVSHLLVQLMPAIDVVDLGAGESFMAQLIAQRARSVTCIDNSPNMVKVGTELAQKHGFDNISYKLGDLEAVPLQDQQFDLALLSQALHHAVHPSKAIAEAHRLLKPGGRILILDLAEHQFSQAHELYSDHWLGFSKSHISEMLQENGFRKITLDIVDTEEQEPHFQTLLASALKQ